MLTGGTFGAIADHQYTKESKRNVKETYKSGQMTKEDYKKAKRDI